MEDQIKAAGIKCSGKELIPKTGELNPDIIAEVLLSKKAMVIEYDKGVLANRPPTLCAGCPHRGFFYELAKNKNIMITSDIGCYGSGGMDPLNAKDTCICMGGGVGMGHGAQMVFNKFNENMRTVSIMGDSTFFHTGINGILNAVFNRSNAVICILDNRTTGMTGHQENPGTGFTLQGDPTAIVDIANLVKALGVNNIRVVNPLRLNEVKEALQWALGNKEVTVIITRWPCVLKQQTESDKKEFGNYFAKCKVDEGKCTGCRMCVKTGCPALRYDKESKKVIIDNSQCAGCEVCVQVCPVKAISKV